MKKIQTTVKCNGEYCGGAIFIPREFSPGEFTDICHECEEAYRQVDELATARSAQYEREVTAWMYGLEMPQREVTQCH